MTQKKKDVQINLTGKHLEITDGIREHVEDKVRKLPRYYDSITVIDVIIESNHGGAQQSVEVIARAEHNKVFVARDQGSDTYNCIDAAVHKIERQLSKQKDMERNNKHTQQS